MNVFVSYRRDDTRDLAGRLADRLRAVPEIRAVFLDVDEIAPGADFAMGIERALARDPVCLIVIGDRWVGERDGGVARIHDDGDFVRREAAAALASSLRVVPVLANNAAMPVAATLPADLGRLPTLNAVPLRHATFDHDVNFLIEAVLDRKKPGRAGALVRRYPMLAGVLYATAGAAVAAVLLLVAAVIHRAVLGRSLADTIGGAGPVWILIVGVLAAGAAVGLRFRPRWRR